MIGKNSKSPPSAIFRNYKFFHGACCCFRACHSTLDNICRLQHDARMAIMQKKFCITLLIDISQAFDTVWHHGLLMKIKEIGLNEYLANFLKGFLNDREIFIRNLSS